MVRLTQTQQPFLWNCFQWAIGGTVDKRRLCTRYYSGQQRVLEVGCSGGNIAVAFLGWPGIRYVGVDVDQTAIEFAGKRFARFGNFIFTSQELPEMAKSSDRFEYILLASVLHHLDDGDSRSLLHAATELLDDPGLLVIVDPVLPEPEDSSFYHFFLRTFEQGRYVRGWAALDALLKSEPGLKPCGAESCVVGATPIGLPKCARFGIWRFQRLTLTLDPAVRPE